MDFSFSTTAGASQSTTKIKLEGNNIYEVKFAGCELKDIQGVKDPEKVFKQIILKFENEDGVFEHTVWEPRPEDFDRRVTERPNQKTGKVDKITQPSNVESMMLLFKHLIDAVAPVTGKKIDEKQASLGAPNWDALRKLVEEIFTKSNSKGVNTKIKLLKNKEGEAIFPGYFAGLTKEGLPYVKNNFIGSKIAFSSYELQKMTQATTTNTTRVADMSFSSSGPESDDSLDIKFDVSTI